MLSNASLAFSQLNVLGSEDSTPEVDVKRDCAQTSIMLRNWHVRLHTNIHQITGKGQSDPKRSRTPLLVRQICFTMASCLRPPAWTLTFAQCDIFLKAVSDHLEVYVKKASWKLADTFGTQKSCGYMAPLFRSRPTLVLQLQPCKEPLSSMERRPSPGPLVLNFLNAISTFYVMGNSVDFVTDGSFGLKTFWIEVGRRRKPFCNKYKRRRWRLGLTTDLAPWPGCEILSFDRSTSFTSTHASRLALIGGLHWSSGIWPNFLDFDRTLGASMLSWIGKMIGKLPWQFRHWQIQMWFHRMSWCHKCRQVLGDWHLSFLERCLVLRFKLIFSASAVAWVPWGEELRKVGELFCSCSKQPLKLLLMLWTSSWLL